MHSSEEQATFVKKRKDADGAAVGAPKQATENGTFGVGKMVLLQNLSKEELNGKRGQIVKPGANGRWGVQLIGETEPCHPYSVKETNLQVLNDPAPTSAPELELHTKVEAVFLPEGTW